MTYDPDSYKHRKSASKADLKTYLTHTPLLNLLHIQRKECIENHDYEKAKYYTELGSKTASQMEYSFGIKPYLACDYWKEISEKLKSSTDCCDLCRRPKELLNNLGIRLEVHHHSYDNLFCEKNSDLVVWCAECHNHQENVYGLKNLKRQAKKFKFESCNYKRTIDTKNINLINNE